MRGRDKEKAHSFSIPFRNSSWLGQFIQSFKDWKERHSGEGRKTDSQTEGCEERGRREGEKGEGNKADGADIITSQSTHSPWFR